MVSNIACDFSFTTIAKTLGASVHTVQNYADYLEEAFLIFQIPRFSWKVKNQISANKKIYCIDNGFVNAKGFKVSPGSGRLYENVVAVALKQRELAREIDLFFWKNDQQEEVDFAIKQGAEVTELIQVCYDLSQPKTKGREVPRAGKGERRAILRYLDCHHRGHGGHRAGDVGRCHPPDSLRSLVEMAAISSRESQNAECIGERIPLGHVWRALFGLGRRGDLWKIGMDPL